jgi:hypothetical protein
VHHVSWAEGAQQQQLGTPEQQHDSSQYGSSSSNSSPTRSDLHATVIEPMPVTVPLSSVPTAALGVSTAEEKAQKLGTASNGSMVASTAASSKTGRLSQLLDAEKAKAQKAKLHINRPRQVSRHTLTVPSSNPHACQVACTNCAAFEPVAEHVNARVLVAVPWLLPVTKRLPAIST